MPPSEKLLKDLQKGLSELTRYIEKNKIETIVITGKSAFIARNLLREYWIQTRNPMIDRIKFFSLGDRTSQMKQRIFEEKKEKSYVLQTEDIEWFKGIDGGKLAKTLEKEKNKRVMILDEVVSSGRTLFLLKQIFKSMGFKDIKLAAIGSLDLKYNSEVKRNVFVPKVLQYRRDIIYLYGLRRKLYSYVTNQDKPRRTQEYLRELAQTENLKNKKIVDRFGEYVRENPEPLKKGFFRRLFRRY